MPINHTQYKCVDYLQGATNMQTNMTADYNRMKTAGLIIFGAVVATVTEFQNTFAYLNGATRVETRMVRRTMIGYRCPSSRTLLDTPDNPDCVMEITEVDEPMSYLVSTGDDGFIAENDQKIPLRPLGPGVDRAFENNFRAGLNSSCNHFTEGNHPEVHQTISRLLTNFNSNNPFFVP